MSESIKATLWDLTSIEACLQSMEREAQQMDADKQALTGRAWMLLTYRASALSDVARSVRATLLARGLAPDAWTFQRHLLADVDWPQLPWSLGPIAKAQADGRWHQAFAIRCAKSTREEALACLMAAAFNQFRQPAQPTAQPEALAG